MIWARRSSSYQGIFWIKKKLFSSDAFSYDFGIWAAVFSENNSAPSIILCAPRITIGSGTLFAIFPGSEMKYMITIKAQMDKDHQLQLLPAGFQIWKLEATSLLEHLLFHKPLAFFFRITLEDIYHVLNLAWINVRRTSLLGHLMFHKAGLNEC